MALAVCAIWLEPLRLVVVLVGATLAAVVLVDWLRTPAPRDLAVDRRVPSRVGLSQPFERALEVRGPAGLLLTVFEEAPPGLSVSSRTVAGEVALPAGQDPTGGADTATFPARGVVSVRRTYVPAYRGRLVLGSVRLRLRGPWGLIERQARQDGESAVRVEPPLVGLKHNLRLAASERWQDLGVRRLRQRGGQTEFESLRAYVPGDDVRRIDWKAYARRGRPTVRRYEEERGQELVILVDSGRRMGATTAEGDERGWTKLDHALDAALQLAAVALSKGDRVGIGAFAADLRAYVGPARGTAHLARLTEAVFDLAPSERESDLEGALRAVIVRQRRRGTVVLFSDVADPLSVAAQGRALSVGAHHHRLIFAGLDDPSVRRVADGERRERPSVRAAACELLEERARALAELRRSGARVLDSLPAEAAAPVLSAWLAARGS